jgi:hypothetical protein
MTGVIVSPSRGDHPMSRQADSAVVDEVWRASNLADLGDQQSCCCITGLRSHQSTVLLFAQPYIIVPETEIVLSSSHRSGLDLAGIAILFVHGMGKHMAKRYSGVITIAVILT